jgi:hypothetical protein
MKVTSPSRASRSAANGSECQDGVRNSSTHLEGEVVAIVCVGIDLAKNVFAVHGVEHLGRRFVSINPPGHTKHRTSRRLGAGSENGDPPSCMLLSYIA